MTGDAFAKHTFEPSPEWQCNGNYFIETDKCDVVAPVHRAALPKAPIAPGDPRLISFCSPCPPRVTACSSLFEYPCKPRPHLSANITAQEAFTGFVDCGCRLENCRSHQKLGNRTSSFLRSAVTSSSLSWAASCTSQRAGSMTMCA